MLFDEESMFKTAPNIIRINIRNNDESAKDYLRGRLLEKEDIELLSEFGQYTIEALIVHVLGMVFNSLEYNSIIRVASLVERLESSVRIQASLLKSRRCKKPLSMASDKVKKSGKELKRSKLEMQYPFGSALVQFMEERKLRTLNSDLSGTVQVKKKKGSPPLISKARRASKISLRCLQLLYIITTDQAQPAYGMQTYRLGECLSAGSKTNNPVRSIRGLLKWENG